MKKNTSHLLQVTCQVHLKAEEVKSFLKERKKPPSAPDSRSRGQRQHSAPREVSPKGEPHSYPPKCLLPGSPTIILSQLNSPPRPFTPTCSAHLLTLGKVMPPLNRAHSVIWLFPSLRPTDRSSECFLQMQNTRYKIVIHYATTQSGEKKRLDSECTRILGHLWIRKL